MTFEQHATAPAPSALCARIEALIAGTEALATLLAREREALLGNDVAALETLTRDKHAHAVEIERLSRDIEQQRVAAGLDGLHALLAASGVEPQAGRRLAELAAHCLAANRDNAALLAARQQQIRSALQLLRPGALTAYGRGGAQSLSFGSRSFGAA
ncbi:flagellar protein FlgN [Sinimarinibacterium sp. HSW-8]|uniref:Flagellar protein FlgN n=2 Tax=Sinimarinibacterium thermocellulolyticum TaxID=3170016 RepID=A0ABV2AA28_9GAMM